jgi:lipopolysaccharide biosynthesis protein
MKTATNNKVATRAIAFYLPQFHPVPENDEWWGKGFTEWRNVAKARPLFPGHYQPHLPADLGFYDLRLPEAREAQAALARQYGIDGFCYYHYWFNGRRILERPFNEVLASGQPDFPFCLCWANENWTRRWEGDDKNVLLEQRYNHQDDLAHIQSLFPAFRDPRYIRVDERPLFLVYRAEFLPDPIRTTSLWREAAREAGIGDLFLARVESHESFRNPVSPKDIGFDAEVEFAPFSGPIGKFKFRSQMHKLLAKIGLSPKGYAANRVTDYQAMVHAFLSRPDPDWLRFHCVTPSWDNSARRQDALIFHGSTPQKYEAWLKQLVAKTAKKYQDEERLVFVNAWNEWAEGNHLEPDLEWGLAYLEATKRALSALGSEQEGVEREAPRSSDMTRPSALKQLYWRLSSGLKEQFEFIKALGFRKD